MKTTCKKLLAFVLAVLYTVSFVACSDGKSTVVQNGIEIGEDPPYDGDVLERAENALLSLIRYAYLSVSPLNKITQTVEKRLADYAERICAVTAEKPVSREQYICMIEALERDGKKIIDELLEFFNGTDASFRYTRELYLLLSDIFGAEAVASILYDICLIVYDVKYEKAKERFENYGYPWYETEANELLKKKEDFLRYVGRNDFSAFTRCATAFAEIFLYDMNNGTDAFLDSELLMLVQSLDVNEIGIEEQGYVLLMSLIAPQNEPDRDAVLLQKLRYEFVQSGDSDRIAAVMDDAVTLIQRTLCRLTEPDIRDLREKGYRSLSASVFSRFTEEDWTIFARVTAVSLSNDRYSLLSKEEYGEDYTSFLESIRNIDIDELRETVGTDGFYDCLCDYLIAICPALAYEVKK